MRWATQLIDYASGSHVLDLLVRRQPERPPANYPMLLNSTASCQGDSRRHPRSNVALAAELQHNSERVPATIGNLSRCGAMLKTSLPLEPGAAVHLLRGELCSKATVIWCSGSGCGLAFSNEIQVGEWVLPVSNVGQRRINQLVALVKAEKSTPEATLPASGSQPELHFRPQLMSDVAIVLQLLADLKADLTSSSDTVGRHREGLQQLDAAIRMLSSEQLQRRSRHQFVESLSAPFELLRSVEDEMTSCHETLARHNYKLQHVDLAMQMLEEVAASLLVGDGEQPLGLTRLPRLRTACEQALGPK